MKDLKRNIGKRIKKMITRQKKNEADEKDGIQFSTKFKENKKTILE